MERSRRALSRSPHGPWYAPRPMEQGSTKRPAQPGRPMISSAPCAHLHAAETTDSCTEGGEEVVLTEFEAGADRPPCERRTWAHCQVNSPIVKSLLDRAPRRLSRPP